VDGEEGEREAWSWVHAGYSKECRGGKVEGSGVHAILV
jgi:hypothetical protein